MCMIGQGRFLDKHGEYQSADEEYEEEEEEGQGTNVAGGNQLRGRGTTNQVCCAHGVVRATVVLVCSSQLNTMAYTMLAPDATAALLLGLIGCSCYAVGANYVVSVNTSIGCTFLMSGREPTSMPPPATG